MTDVTLRQQLSYQSQQLLEAAAQTELKRLRALQDELTGLQADEKLLHRVRSNIDRVLLAINQLNFVYIDQFEAGRTENDQAGRLGLVSGQEASAALPNTEHP